MAVPSGSDPLLWAKPAEIALDSRERSSTPASADDSTGGTTNAIAPWDNSWRESNLFQLHIQPVPG